MSFGQRWQQSASATLGRALQHAYSIPLLYTHRLRFPGVTTIVNLEEHGEHAHCGPGNNITGFAYDAQKLLDAKIGAPFRLTPATRVHLAAESHLPRIALRHRRAHFWMDRFRRALHGIRADHGARHGRHSRGARAPRRPLPRWCVALVFCLRFFCFFFSLFFFFFRSSH